MTLEILTHPTLHPLKHGFFTRKGGASSGLFAGLNCGRGSSDQKEVVAINRARVAAALGLPPERLATVNQTHSDRVVTLTGTEDLDAVDHVRARPALGGGGWGAPRATRRTQPRPGAASSLALLKF